MKINKRLTVESLFPNARGRQLADETIDALPETAPMTEYLDAWEAAYFKHVGRSPFRP